MSDSPDVTLPTTMNIGDRAYEILLILRDGEASIRGSVMVDRAKETNANLGEEECEHLLVHQNYIPVAFQGKVAFMFTNWRRPDYSGGVACVYWNGGRWVRHWDWLDDDWHGSYRVLRRK